MTTTELETKVNITIAGMVRVVSYVCREFAPDQQITGAMINEGFEFGRKPEPDEIEYYRPIALDIMRQMAALGQSFPDPNPYHLR